ncbi:MarR family transcriptional regulator [Cellulomonas sp. RIT-PI-Y]|uniref:MarR family winged helix-turn-helix transcriptional regulator n=1 Tax=Cellulomonas sp. RIT-PI-Y TaxID=3035297 RepID=UPI0021DAEFAA|nr:MarR family transcriptional regulator [Cellulomonas sp. RIT-PI-Y]
MIGEPEATALRSSFALMDVSAHLQRVSGHYLRSAGGLTYVQFRILMRLAFTDRPSLRMHELAQGAVISRSGLTYQVTTLEARGLCTRSAAQDDDRGVTASITGDGRAVVERLAAGYAEVVRQAFLGLRPEHTRDLTAILAAVGVERS